jgi:phenylacetate-coenzyme A ligase PaaK-like adenylate-forming protein
MSEHDVLSQMLDWPTFGVDQAEKSRLMLEGLNALTLHHREHCSAYDSILHKLWPAGRAQHLEDLPFLPVRLFKHERLLSVADEDIVKTMTSSGTSGQNVSQIFLDKTTSALQVKVLSRIVGDFIGNKRLPMLVIDSRSTVANRLKFSARTAGILGFSMFGRELEFALDDDMTLNVPRVEAFLQKYPDQPMLVFGFTFIVWLHLVRWLESRGGRLNLPKGILIHGGGWKQLESVAVHAGAFKDRLQAVTGIAHVHNYYGMVEQTGSIFMACEAGHMHASSWSDVIIREPLSFKPLPKGEPGLVQLLSLIPRSYPGHSLLSEDEGVVLGTDDCPCGRKGTYFTILGRLKNAETRGCSDTYTR